MNLPLDIAKSKREVGQGHRASKPSSIPGGTPCPECPPTRSDVVILGPTTVGKTEVAFQLARLISANVINADKFYLYKSMPEVTGQSDASRYSDVPSHLYGEIEPNQDRWRSERYYDEARNCLAQIRARGRTAIFEGCSNEFIRTAIDAVSSGTALSKSPPLLISLRWKHWENVSTDCERRATQMLSSGMLDAFRRELAKGLGDSFTLKKCFARDHLLARLRGRIRPAACCNRIADSLERHALHQYRMLRRIPGVVWLDHDRRTPIATLDAILALLRAALTSKPGLLV